MHKNLRMDPSTIETKKEQPEPDVKYQEMMLRLVEYPVKPLEMPEFIAPNREQTIDFNKRIKKSNPYTILMKKHNVTLANKVQDKYPEQFDKFMEEVYDQLIPYQSSYMRLILNVSTQERGERLMEAIPAEIRAFHRITEIEKSQKIIEDTSFTKDFLRLLYQLQGVNVYYQNLLLNSDDKRRTYKVVLNKLKTSLDYEELFVYFTLFVYIHIPSEISSNYMRAIREEERKTTNNEVTAKLQYMLTTDDPAGYYQNQIITSPTSLKRKSEEQPIIFTNIPKKRTVESDTPSTIGETAYKTIQPIPLILNPSHKVDFISNSSAQEYQKSCGFDAEDIGFLFHVQPQTISYVF